MLTSRPVTGGDRQQAVDVSVVYIFSSIWKLQNYLIMLLCHLFLVWRIEGGERHQALNIYYYCLYLLCLNIIAELYLHASYITK